MVACGYSVLTLFARIFAKWGLLGVEDIIIAVGYVSFASNPKVMIGTDVCRSSQLSTGDSSARLRSKA